jgi:hypothetical protein
MKWNGAKKEVVMAYLTGEIITTYLFEDKQIVMGLTSYPLTFLVSMLQLESKKKSL